jgi:hypothetical protein
MLLARIRGQQFPNGLMKLHLEELHRRNHRQLNLMSLSNLLVRVRIQQQVL